MLVKKGNIPQDLVSCFLCCKKLREKAAVVSRGRHFIAEYMLCDANVPVNLNFKPKEKGLKPVIF